VVVAGNEPEGEASAASIGGPGSPAEPPTPAGGPSPTAAADPAAHPAQPQPEPEQSLAEVARARRRRAAKAVGALVVFIVLVLFIVANSQPVEVNFLFFKANPRLIWEMVTCAVLGGVLGYMLGRPGREGKAKKKDGGAPPAR
jgi:uncharacterized integral membrane protein